MKVRLAVGVFLAFLPVLAFAQSTTAQQLLQALLPPNAVTPQVSAPISPPVTSSVATSSKSKATLLQSLYAELQTLEAEIAAIEAAQNHTACAISITRTLTIGSQGTDVTQLQQTLVSLGFLAATPTGYFGTLTQAAVIKFQTAHGLEPVGYTGPQTRAALAALQCTTTTGGSSSGTPTTPVTIIIPPTATSTAPGTPTTIINYTPPAEGGGGGGGGGGSSGGTTTPPPNYGNGIFAQFFQNGTLSIPSGNVPTAASQITVNSLLSYALGGAIGNDTMLLPAGTVIQNSTNGSPIDVTTLNTQDIASTSVSGITTETPVGVLQWGTPSIPLSFTQPITLAIAVDPGFNGDTLDIYDSESQSGPWAQTGLATPTCLITNGLCQFQTTSASFFAAAKKKPTVTISASPTTVTYGNSSTITWSSTNATSCTASNGWSGTKATSGIQTFTNLTTNQTYTLTCSNRANSATQSASVTVTGSAPDTTPPSAPTNLGGSATSQTQINLTWTASTDNVGVTGYNIYRAGTLIATSTLTSYSNIGLTASRQYTYTVKAFDAAGNISAASNSINVTTQTPPAPTATINANPTSVTSGGSSTLTWSSSNATSCTASNGWSGTKATSGTQSLTNLTATSTYTLTCTGAGGSANQSATIGVTTLDTTPPSVTITAPASNLAANTTQTTLAVTTNENATCAYSTNSGAAFASMTLFTTTGATSHSTTLSPLANGTSYTYYVKCKDTAGNISGNASVTFSVATSVDTTPPSVPTNLVATAVSSSAINLSWTASTDNVGVTGYDIYRGGTQIGTSPTNSYSDTGLTASTQYSYTVAAYDAAGNNSAQSTGVSATTQASGGSYVGFLDTYSSLGATWGFSPYKLTNAYAGNWGTIERQSDGATTAIGFLSNGKVNVAAFNSFCANTNCYITTLDDQVNGINATQTTFSKMPRVIVDLNGMLAVCPQPSSTMTTSYNPKVNTAGQHLFAVAQLNYWDNRWSQPTVPSIAVTGNLTQNSFTITNMSSQVGMSLGTFWGGQLGVTDSSGYLPNPSYISSFPSGSTADITTPGGFVSTSKTNASLNFYNPVTGGAWIVNGPAGNASYANYAYWAFGAGQVNDDSPADIVTPVNGEVQGYQGIFGNGMRGLWAVYDYDTNTQQTDYDGVSLGQVPLATHANIDYSTNTGMTLFSDTSGAENTSNSCFETMVLFPATESSRVPMAQTLMTQDNISFPFAPATSDGFTWTGYYQPSFTDSPTSVYGAYSVGPDAHGLTWYTQTGGYTWPSLSRATNITNGATMWRFIVEPGDSDVNITQAERSEINTSLSVAPGHYFSTFYQFEFEQMQSQTGPWATIGQFHYNNNFGGDAPDLISLDIDNGVGQFVYQNTVGGNSTTYDCGSSFPLTVGVTYAVTTSGYWSANQETDTLSIWAGPNGGTLTQICNLGPTHLWDNDSGGYMKAGIYRGFPWQNPGTIILREMNIQFVDTQNAFSSYVTTQPPLPTNSGSGGTPAPTCSISASPSSITSGQSSTLTWTSTNGTSATLNGSSVSLNSSQPTVTTTYTLNVTGAGNSASCNTAVTVSSAGDTSPPSTPTNLSATAISSSAINLTWTASTDNVAVTGYKIYRGGTQIGTSPTNSYSDTGLTASTQYTYTVSAYDAAGNNSAQSSSASATTQAGSGGGSYTAPTDVLSSPVFCLSLRACSGASAGSAVVRLVRTSDNTQEDIDSLSNGNLDITTASTFCASTTCKVVTWYDQSGANSCAGAACNFTTTAGSAPTFTFNCIGSLPCITFTFSGGSDHRLTAATGPTVAQPFIVAAVSNRTAYAANAELFETNEGFPVGLGYPAAGDEISMQAGAGPTVTEIDGSWYAIAGVFNGASSNIYLDGASNSVSPGTNGATGQADIGTLSDGKMTEVLMWNSASNGTQASALSSNQRAYWGF